MAWEWGLPSDQLPRLVLDPTGSEESERRLGRVLRRLGGTKVAERWVPDVTTLVISLHGEKIEVVAEHGAGLYLLGRRGLLDEIAREFESET